jgi:hypothetical protein
MNETNTDRVDRKRRETTQLLLGAGGILLFGIALVAWPRLGNFIGDAVDCVRDLFQSFHP